MQPMNLLACGDVQPLLGLQVGGDLEDSDQGGLVLEHLARCEACAAELERLTAARTALLELEWRSPAPRIDVWSSVRAQLQSEGLLMAPAVAPAAALASQPVQSGGSGRRMRQSLAALAASLLLCAGTWITWNSGAPSLVTPAVQTPRGPSGPALAGSTVSQPAAMPIEPSVQLPLASSARESLVVPVAEGGLRRLSADDQRFGAQARDLGGNRLDVVGPWLVPNAERSGNRLAGDGLR